MKDVIPTTARQVRARVPEKQGLKHDERSDPGVDQIVRARVPEKQGLKRPEKLTLRASRRVRARVPEKQGLKRYVIKIYNAFGSQVRARVPEKQGLKPGIVGYPQQLKAQSGREFQKNKD